MKNEFMQPLSKSIYWIIFLALIIIWGFGVSTLNIPDDIPWTSLGINNLFRFSIPVIIFFIVVIMTARNYAWHIITGTIFFIIIASVSFSPVATVIYILVSALLLGNQIFCFFKRNSNENSDLILSCFLGLCLLVTILGPMMFFKIHYPIVYLLILFIPFLTNANRLKDWFNKFASFFVKEKRFSYGQQLGMVAVFYFCCLHLTVALLPETGHDALAMHLMVPAYISNHHFWPFDVSQHIWAVMPMNGDWLYTLAYMLGGEEAARLINYSLFLLIAGLLFQSCRRFLSFVNSLFIVVLYISLPLAFLETGSLFIDTFWAGLLFSATISLYRLHETGEIIYLFLIAVLSGTALATKLGTIAYIPVVFGFVLYELFRKNDTPKLFCISIFFFLLLIFSMFTYLNAYIITGNPVFPFFNEIFNSPFYRSDISFNNNRYNAGIGLTTLYHLTFSSTRYLEGTNGAFGFSLLVMLPLSCSLIFVKKTYLSIMLPLISLVFIIVTFSGQSYLRYIYPTTPIFFFFVAVMLAFLIKTDIWLFRSLFWFGIISVILNLIFFPSAGWPHRSFEFNVLSKETKEDFLYNHAPVRKAVDYINLVYGKSANVGFFSKPRIAGLKGQAYTNTWHNSGFSKAVSKARNTEKLLNVFKKYRLTHCIVTPDRAKPIIDLLNKITEEEFSYKGVSVLKVSSKYFFSKELIKNGQFNNGLANWRVMPGVNFLPDRQSIVVSVHNHAKQIVPVTPNTRYALSVLARSHTPDTSLRIQVNWRDNRGKFLSTSTSAQLCGPDFKKIDKELISPENAVTGVVFAKGHSDQPVEIKRVSIKE